MWDSPDLTYSVEKNSSLPVRLLLLQELVLANSFPVPGWEEDLNGVPHGLLPPVNSLLLSSLGLALRGQVLGIPAPEAHCRGPRISHLPHITASWYACRDFSPGVTLKSDLPGPVPNPARPPNILNTFRWRNAGGSPVWTSFSISLLFTQCGAPIMVTFMVGFPVLCPFSPITSSHSPAAVPDWPGRSQSAQPQRSVWPDQKQPTSSSSVFLRHQVGAGVKLMDGFLSYLKGEGGCHRVQGSHRGVQVTGQQQQWRNVIMNWGLAHGNPSSTYLDRKTRFRTTSNA